MQEMPYVQKMKAIMGRSLDVLPVAVEPPGPGKRYQLPNIKMPLFYSRTISKMMGGLGMDGIPAVLLYSPDGRLLHKEMGAKDWSSPESIQFLKNRIH